MKWLFVIDPIENLHMDTDSTVAIMEEAASRKIDVYYSTITDLLYDRNAQVAAKKFGDKGVKNVIFELDLFDLIFMRKEPPYDLNFHYATLLLSLTKTKVVNSPRALRDFNEKTIILNFPKLIPETIVTSREETILNFVQKRTDIVIKSLDSFQGRSVVKFNHKDKDIKAKIADYTFHGKTQVMVQEFIPTVTLGDKRILLLNGKILGAVNRIPKQGSVLSNFAQGGKGVKTTLTVKDKQIAEAVSGFLVSHGILFAGLDVISGYLTEINITCPTGIRQINTLENTHLEKDIVDFFSSYNSK
jgi:glutathione synthase